MRWLANHWFRSWFDYWNGCWFASIIPYLGFGVGIIAAVIATLFQFGIDWMQLF
jgi:hypothetical protein